MSDKRVAPSPPGKPAAPPAGHGASSAFTLGAAASSKADVKADVKAADKKTELERVEKIPELSAALEMALREVMPSTDPLDAKDFDPVAFINEKFPTESSLSATAAPASASAAAVAAAAAAAAAVSGANGTAGASNSGTRLTPALDAYLASLRRRVITLNDQIAVDVRTHSTERSKTQAAIGSARAAISDLFHKIRAIKEKAKHSEVMVQEICRDIKSLDYAKRHLTTTIRALRNFHMLMSAVESLSLRAQQRRYRDVAKLLLAIQDFFTLFDEYKDVPKIQALSAAVTKHKGDVKKQIWREFETLLPTLTNPGHEKEHETSVKSLFEACYVVEVLGADAQKELVQWYSKIQMEIPYNSLFAFGKAEGKLDATERRYNWLRREVLKPYDEVLSMVFPKDWDVAALCSRDFCNITRGHLSKVLAASEKENKLDITVVVMALTRTIEFERELTARFRDHAVPLDVSAPADPDDDPQLTTKSQAELIRARYAQKKAAEDAAKKAGVDPKTGKPAAAAAAGAGSSSFAIDESRFAATERERAKEKPLVDKSQQPKPQPINFDRMISDAFVPYLGGYVELERKKILELLGKIAAEEMWHLQDTKVRETKPHLKGSDDLFLYIRKSLKQCVKLTKGEILYNVFKEFKRGLMSYTELLDSKLPKKAPGTAVTTSEIQTICLIINTCEYCTETLPPLEESVKKVIDEKWREHVDMSKEQDEFNGVMGKGVSLLVGSIMGKVNRQLDRIPNMKWDVVDTVGDQSDYVSQIHAIFREELPPIAAILTAPYHESVCRNVTQSFLQKFLERIFQCRRIVEAGAQQLQLDTHSLKSILCELSAMRQLPPGLGAAADAKEAHAKAAPNKALVRYVEKEMKRAEGIFKLLSGPIGQLVPTWRAVLYRDCKSTAEELVKIMALRGLTKKDMEALVGQYNAQEKNEDERIVLPKEENESSLRALLSTIGRRNN